MAAKQYMEKSMSAVKRRIIITEAQLKRLLENKTEYLPADFLDDIKRFMEDLRTNPANAEVPERMKSYGIDRPKLIDAIITKNLAKRKQKPKEVEGKDGKKTARMITIYDIKLDNASKNIGEVYEDYFKLGKWPTFTFGESKDSEDVMDEEALFEVELDSEMDEAMSASASGQYTVPFMGDAETLDHTDIVRKSFNAYNPKTKKIDESIDEAKDRSQYWKDRWKKQKEDGTVPDRSEYWKERAKKQKSKRKTKKNNTRHPQRWSRDEEEDIWSRLNDNDFGEYFGDHD